jgi:hypothetical protein
LKGPVKKDMRIAGVYYAQKGSDYDSFLKRLYLHQKALHPRTSKVKERRGYIQSILIPEKPPVIGVTVQVADKTVRQKRIPRVLLYAAFKFKVLHTQRQ